MVLKSVGQEDTPYPCDSALQDNQTEQLGENKVQNVSEIVNNDTTQTDVPNPVKKRSKIAQYDHLPCYC